MKRVLFAVLFAVVSISAFAQTNTGSTIITGYQYWPLYPPVGIGTQGFGGPWHSAMQIHYDGLDSTQPALLRFSQGGSTNTEASGIVALLSTLSGLSNPSWMHLTSLMGTDSANMPFVIRANHGDLILTDNWKDTITGAIRLATRPRTALLPPGTIDTDYERLTIMGNGNVGININPDGALCRPKEQLQIGGSSGIPGLTIYGGNRFEGMARPTGGGNMPTDWRYINFNSYTDHYDTSSSRYHRFGPMSTSGISFSKDAGGLLQFSSYPYDSARGIDNFSHNVTLTITGNSGLNFYSDESDSLGITYYHLFDCWRPRVLAGDVTRDSFGLFFHHTPVYIGGQEFADFTNFTKAHPTLGDGKTWMLAVNGSLLAKEIVVDDTVWADFVFDPNYKLIPLSEVERFVTQNRHLPDIPSAKEIASSGVNIGKTETKLTQKVEELTLYIIEQNKRIEALEAKLNALERGGK